MLECPYCGSNLNGSTHQQESRGRGAPGRKSTGNELVSCPDCDGVIDGFSAH